MCQHLPRCLQDNFLNKDEMLAALQEVGLLNGIRAKYIGERVLHTVVSVANTLVSVPDRHASFC